MAATVIKKYGDRRLYDTAARSYVKLDDIARMIREGAEVEVRDARTGKDLTRVILTQIIVEDARGSGGGLPIKLLRQLVVASDRATHDFVSWYMERAMDVYQKAGSAVRHLIGGDSAEVEQLRGRVRELEEALESARAPSRLRPPRKTAPRRSRQD